MSNIPAATLIPLPPSLTQTSSLTSDQLSAISLAATTSASFSFLGAFILILMFFLGGSKKNDTKVYFGRNQMLSRMVLCIAMADLISSVAYFIGRMGSRAGTGSIMCTSQSFMEQWGDLASIFFTGSLAMNLVLVLYCQYTAIRLESVERVYFIGNFLGAFILALIPVFIKDNHGVPVYGADTLWCWITDEWQELRFGLFYIPLWTMFLFNLIMYSIAGRELFRKAYRPPKDEINGSGTLEWPTPIYSPATDCSSTMSSQNLSPRPMNSIVGRNIDEHTEVSAVNSFSTMVHHANNGYKASANHAHDILQPHNLSISPFSPPTPQSVKLPLPTHQAPPSPTLTTVRAIQKRYAKTNYRTIYVKKVFIFLLAFLLTWSFATVNRIQNYLYPNSPSYILSMLQASTTPLRGFLNFLAYFYAGIWLVA